MARIHTLVLLGALLAGCARGEFKMALPHGALGGVTLGIRAHVAAGRTIQALVEPYTPADVDHLDFELFKESDGSFTPIASQSTPGGSGTSKAVAFSHLKMNSTYKVVVTCRHDGGVSLNKEGSGAVSVTTTHDDFMPLSVSVSLMDKIFDGQAKPMVSVASGSVVNTPLAESGSVVVNL